MLFDSPRVCLDQLTKEFVLWIGYTFTNQTDQSFTHVLIVRNDKIITIPVDDFDEEKYMPIAHPLRVPTL